MIALDTTILVHAHRPEMVHHARAVELLHSMARGAAPWAIPWPCVYEFFRVVTHPQIWDPASDPADVLADLESLLGAPSLVMLGPGPHHLDHLLTVFDQGDVRGFRGLGPVRAVDPFTDPDRLREPRRRDRVHEQARP